MIPRLCGLEVALTLAVAVLARWTVVEPDPIFAGIAGALCILTGMVWLMVSLLSVAIFAGWSVDAIRHHHHPTA